MTSASNVRITVQWISNYYIQHRGLLHNELRSGQAAHSTYSGRDSYCGGGAHGANGNSGRGGGDGEGGENKQIFWF